MKGVEYALVAFVNEKSYRELATYLGQFNGRVKVHPVLEQFPASLPDKLKVVAGQFTRGAAAASLVHQLSWPRPRRSHPHLEGLQPRSPIYKMHRIETYIILKYLVAPLPRDLPDSLDSVVPLEMKEPSELSLRLDKVELALLKSSPCLRGM